MSTTGVAKAVDRRRPGAAAPSLPVLAATVDVSLDSRCSRHRKSNREPGDANVDLGLRQVVAATEPQEGALEFGPGVVGLDIAEIDAAELRLADRRCRNAALQVGDGPCRGGDRDAAADGHVVRGK